MGRKNEKRDFTEAEIRQIYTMSGYGLTEEQMAVILGVSRATFQRRAKEIPEVAEALLKGRAEINAKVVETAYQMAVSGKNTVMTIFWLKCRAHWKEEKGIDEDQRDKSYTADFGGSNAASDSL